MRRFEMGMILPWRELERRFKQALKVHGPESVELRSELNTLEAAEREGGVQHTLSADDVRNHIVRSGYVVYLTHYTIRDDWGCPGVEYRAEAARVGFDPATDWPDLSRVAQGVGSSKLSAYMELYRLMRCKGLMS
jgi:hypothetical protein